MRRGGKEVLAKLPPVHDLAKRWEEHMKGMVLPGTLFEEFGFNYIGPIDGHDLEMLVRTLANVRELPGPQFLHVITKKGYGYPKAEEDPILYHGVTKFDPAVGIVPKPAGEARVHAGLRRLAVRHGGARRAHRRHHARDARRLGARALLAAVSRSATSTSASPSSTR